MKIQPINMIKKASTFLAFIFVCAITVAAQSNTGTVTGQVQDSTGAAVANATVVVTNIGTNESRTVQTNDEGFYDAPSLSVGVYKITATASGFQETTVSDARLAVGERLRVDVQMGVGQVSASVQVESAKTDTETATTGDNITTDRIADVPVNGRDFTGLLASIPGSVQTTNQFQTSINGIPSTFGGASVLVDGIDAGRVDLNGTSNVLGRIESRVNRVSMDSIQEVQVLEQNYSAQYGEALSAVINPITKSGTNDFHGSVFDYFRNEALDARDFFAGTQKFRLNQFGANVSGPIARDKLFFFTNYEGVRQTRGINFFSLVPTAAFRASADANIRAALSTIPLPTAPFFRTVNGVRVLDPDSGTFSIQKDSKLREDTGSVKIDWLQSSKSQFSVRYNINDSSTRVPYGVGTDQMTSEGALRVQLFKASHTYTINGSTINEFAFGINNNYSKPDAGPSTLPRFDLSFVDQAFATPGPAQFNQERTGNVYQFLDTLSLVRGNHSVKTGIDIRLNRRSALSIFQDTLIFFSLNDFRNNAPFIISRSGNPESNYANENYALFVQDDWKVHPRLSLNLGLRYDVSTVSREKNGFLQNFDLRTLSFTPPGQQFQNADKNNFGPRFGFAFDVFGNQKTVLRGGYGIFYNRELPASYGSPQVNTFPNLSVDVFSGVFFCANPPATFRFPVEPAVFNCAVRSALAIERDIPTAMAQQWNLNVQQNLGFGTLQVAYVGNHVTHLLTDGVVTPRNINRRDPVTQLRPLTNAFGDILLVGGYPQSNYNALQVTFKRNISKGLRVNANYTWGHAIDDVVGFFRDYQDENNTRAERASSDSDIRHNLAFDASYDLGLREWFGGGPGWLVDGWQLNTITQIRSGFPVNVTRQGGVFGGFSFRPNLVPGVSTECPQFSLPECQFNAAAFTNPGDGVFGNAGRNILRGPGFAQVDFSIFKNTKITERTAVQLRMEIFNLFNHTNFADPSGGLVRGDNNSLNPSAFFGQSTSTVGNQLGGLLGAGGPRQIQFSARYIF